MPPNPPAPNRPFLFRCPLCGRTSVADSSDLRGAVRARWPRCCSREMVLYVVADRPAVTATEVYVKRYPIARGDGSDSTATLPGLPGLPDTPARKK